MSYKWSNSLSRKKDENNRINVDKMIIFSHSKKRVFSKRQQTSKRSVFIIKKNPLRLELDINSI
jgi:hypothetical protein